MERENEEIHIEQELERIKKLKQELLTAMLSHNDTDSNEEAN